MTASQWFNFFYVFFFNLQNSVLKPGIHKFSVACESIGIVRFHVYDRKRDYGGHLDFINFNKSFFQSKGLMILL